MEIPRMQFGRVSVLFGEKNGKYPDGNQVIVTGTDTKAVFDTPLSANRFRAELEGAELVLLGHVHEDHTCGLHLLPQARVLAHAEDVEAIRSFEGLRRHYGYRDAVFEKMKEKIQEQFSFHLRPDAEAYQDGAVWELGGCRVRAVHLPGHTRGHSVLLVEPEGVAFLGDIDLSGFGPYYGDGTSDLRQFQRTLERVRELEASVWVTSHHKGVITDRETFLALLAAFTEKIAQRERAILAAIGDGGRTLEELAAQRFLYPPGYQDVYVEDAERRTIQEHLTALASEGRIVEEEGGRYRAISGQA